MIYKYFGFSVGEMNQNLLNLEKIEFKPTFKRGLFRREDITTLYAEMYQLAGDIAIHEMKKVLARLRVNNAYKRYFTGGKIDDPVELNAKVSQYRDERLKYHMDEMKKILLQFLEAESNRSVKELIQKLDDRTKAIKEKEETT